MTIMVDEKYSPCVGREEMKCSVNLNPPPPFYLKLVHQVVTFQFSHFSLVKEYLTTYISV